MKKTKYRTFTVMLIPHTEESTFSFRLPLFICQAFCVFLLGVAVFLLIMASSYLNLLAQNDELQYLRKVSRAQREEIDALAQQEEELLQETESLLQRVSEVEKSSEAVRALIGLEESEPEESDCSESETENESQGGTSSFSRVLSSRSGSDTAARASANVALLQEIIPDKSEDLEALKVEVKEYQRRLAATPSIWPTRGRIVSGFGMRRSPFNRRRFEFHEGVDIAAPRGTPIYAAASGTVLIAAHRGAWGNMVKIGHGYGYRTLYAHMSRRIVREGERVEKGQLIGYVGSTGRSTGPHLHYEVHVHGVPVDPRGYL